MRITGELTPEPAQRGLDQKRAVAHEEWRRGRNDEHRPVGARQRRFKRQGEEVNCGAERRKFRGGQDGEPRDRAGGHHGATGAGWRGRERVFAWALGVCCGLFVRRGRRDGGRLSAGGARTAGLLNAGGDRRRGRKRGFSLRGRRGRRARNELAPTDAGRQQRLNGDQDRCDNADHASPTRITNTRYSTCVCFARRERPQVRRHRRHGPPVASVPLRVGLSPFVRRVRGAVFGFSRTSPLSTSPTPGSTVPVTDRPRSQP